MAIMESSRMLLGLSRRELEADRRQEPDEERLLYLVMVTRVNRTSVEGPNGLISRVC